MSKVTITRVDESEVIVIKKEDNNFFVTSKDSVVIPIFNFSTIVQTMLYNGQLDPRFLLGLIDDFNELQAN